MKPSSAKAKGRRLQDQIVARLYAAFPALRPGDIRGAIMGESGVDVKMSPHAKDLLPFDIESKNTETASVWAWMKQAKANTEAGRVPLVVFSRNREDTYALLRFEDLIKLTQDANIPQGKARPATPRTNQPAVRGVSGRARKPAGAVPDGSVADKRRRAVRADG